MISNTLIIIQKMYTVFYKEITLYMTSNSFQKLVCGIFKFQVCRKSRVS